MSYNITTNPVQTLSSIYTTTANIIAYDVTTNIATLDAPVDVSLGYNQSLGDVTSQYSINGNSLNISQAIQNVLKYSIENMIIMNNINFISLYHSYINDYSKKIKLSQKRLIDSMEKRKLFNYFIY